MTEQDDQSFDVVLREAISRSGLSLSVIVSSLAAGGHSLTKASLSSWQSGRSVPRRRASRELLPELDRVLGLSPGTLERSLPGDVVDGAPASWVLPPLTAISGIAGEVDEARGLLGLQTDEGLRRDLVQNCFFLDPEGGATVGYRLGLHCTREGAQRLVLAWPTPEGAGPELVQALGGCRTGETWLSAAGTYRIVEVVLPRPLSLGEGWLLELRSTVPLPGPFTSFEAFGPPQGHVTIGRVVFPEGHRPGQVRRGRGRRDREEIAYGPWFVPRGLSVSTTSLQVPYARSIVEWRD